jgi:hypothetical protein
VLRVFNLKTRCLQNPASPDHGRRTYPFININIKTAEKKQMKKTIADITRRRWDTE